MKQLPLLILTFITLNCFGQNILRKEFTWVRQAPNYSKLDTFYLPKGITLDGWYYGTTDTLKGVILDTAALLADGWQMPKNKPSTNKGLLMLSELLFAEFDAYERLSKYYLEINDTDGLEMVVSKMKEIVEQNETIIRILKTN